MKSSTVQRENRIESIEFMGAATGEDNLPLKFPMGKDVSLSLYSFDGDSGCSIESCDAYE